MILPSLMPSFGLLIKIIICFGVFRWNHRACTVTSANGHPSDPAIWIPIDLIEIDKRVDMRKMRFRFLNFYSLSCRADWIRLPFRMRRRACRILAIDKTLTHGIQSSHSFNMFIDEFYSRFIYCSIINLRWRWICSLSLNNEHQQLIGIIVRLSWAYLLFMHRTGNMEGSDVCHTATNRDISPCIDR